METGFSGTSYTDLKGKAIISDYILLGLTRVNFENSINLQSDLDDDFILTYSLTNGKAGFAFYYIFLDTMLRMACAACPEIYAFRDQCYNQCPDNTYVY